MDLDGDVDLLFGNETGIHYVRSNRAQLEPEQAYILLDVVGMSCLRGMGMVPSMVTESSFASSTSLKSSWVTHNLVDRHLSPIKPTLVDEVTSMLLHLGDYAGARLKVPTLISAVEAVTPKFF